MAASLVHPGDRIRWRWQRMAWPALVLAVGVALAGGAGAFSSGGASHLSLYQRTQEVAGQYRCPVCQGESAAVSDAPAAVEIRDKITAWLREGRSPAQIRSYLLRAYGPSILENPPASGADLVVWALPAAAAALALGGLGWGFARWKRAATANAVLAPSQAGAPPEPLVMTAVAQAELSGVEGLRAELVVAPMPGAGVVAVPEAGVAAVAEAGMAAGPEALPATDVAAPASRRAAWGKRAQLVGGSVLVVSAFALWLVDRATTTAPAAASQAAGSFTTELQQAAALAPKNPLAALVLYQEVLRSDPAQPIALAAEGWIYAQSGWVKQGLSALSKAEKADPTYPPPHLYRGLALLQDAHNPRAALPELRWYLGHGPAPAEAAVARKAEQRAQAQLARG